MHWRLMALGGNPLWSDARHFQIAALGTLLIYNFVWLDFGARLVPNAKSRRIYCRPCLDWSERRYHVAGYVGAAFVRKILVESFPTLFVEPMSLDWAAKAAILALFGALIGSFYPALRAARLDPVDALAYE